MESAGSLRSNAPHETRAIGHALGAHAQAGTLVALIGPLGAGKTELAKGVADGLGVTSVVNSPTFVLMNEHPGRLRLFHIDAYRLEDPEESVAAGLFDERQATGVAVVEWADRLGDRLPAERLELTLVPEADGSDRRQVSWRAIGPTHQRLATEALGFR
ncbi:MAG TPA: tRNA (adenosine(37)-N6)-threonylcarbamoyltransferase complex ATPase subunit type 1 TsaE [Methylomirabilota bacterium]|jgi:tRNA threonylcarbamoyladenosine biosynthesis protein TsaE|nr:tRNA (adenosine(37)-N6)-threonylcarbamoyltransferase complex ATPase subunit type 1 TsaE [Methylomirabilota bacterium]